MLGDGSESEVTKLLQDWEPTHASFTNGLIVELTKKFQFTEASLLFKTLLQKVVQLMGNHRMIDYDTKATRKKIFKAMVRIESTKGNNTTAAQPWFFLDDLSEASMKENTTKCWGPVDWMGRVLLEAKFEEEKMHLVFF